MSPDDGEEYLWDRSGTPDPEVQRQNRAADWIELERGFNDPGIVAGNGEYGYETFLDHIDWLHRLGNRVLLGPELETLDQARYELANYFLVRRGRDAIESDYRTDPPGGAGPGYWNGWQVDPGRATGLRRLLPNGLWQRAWLLVNTAWLVALVWRTGARRRQAVTR